MANTQSSRITPQAFLAEPKLPEKHTYSYSKNSFYPLSDITL